jgi:signal transduction histidine kinase
MPRRSKIHQQFFDALGPLVDIHSRDEIVDLAGKLYDAIARLRQQLDETRYIGTDIDHITGTVGLSYYETILRGAFYGWLNSLDFDEEQKAGIEDSLDRLFSNEERRADLTVFLTTKLHAWLQPLTTLSGFAILLEEMAAANLRGADYFHRLEMAAANLREADYFHRLACQKRREELGIKAVGDAGNDQ